MKLCLAILIVLATAAIVKPQQVNQLDLCISDSIEFAKGVKEMVAEKNWGNLSKVSLLLARLSTLVNDCRSLFKAFKTSSGLAGTKQCGDAMVKCFAEMSRKSDFKFPPGTRTINLPAMVKFWTELGIDVSPVLEHCQYALKRRI